ncbi:MAG: MBL fold metallo-hydrolase [Acidobacteria bacterium]|nr:MBL fold metallo-hydrolase [Acidobacteriota bacterium]
MKFFSLFSPVGLSNAYLVGPDAGGDAVLIDPGAFDAPLLQAVEGNGLSVHSILVTHSHSAHIAGIRALLKVYDARIYSNQPSVLDFPARHIADGQELALGGITVRVRETPGHSIDSVCFLIGGMIFTGDTLCAGGIGRTRDGYARGVLLASIQKKLLVLDDGTLVFPGHGPPSTIGIERRFNPYLGEKL